MARSNQIESNRQGFFMTSYLAAHFGSAQEVPNLNQVGRTVKLIKAARNLLRASVNVPPVLSMDLVQHKTEAANQRIPLSGTVGLQIQTALLSEKAETQCLRHGRVLHPPQRSGLLSNVDVHDVREGYLVQFAHLGLARRLLPGLRPPSDGRLRELQSHRLGLAPGPVRNDQNARLAKLLHGSRYDDLIVLLARTAAAQLLLLSTGRWWLILLRAISSSRGSSSAAAANALRRQISVIALRCSTGCLLLMMVV